MNRIATSSRQNDAEEALVQAEYVKKLAAYVADYTKENGKTLSACVNTFGCQMNARDSEKFCGVLLKAGFVLTEDENEADFILYNTCTVRDNANTRLYGHLGYLKSLKKKRPEIKVALCGCMMQEDAAIEKIKKSFPFVNLIFGTHNVFKFAELTYLMYESGGRIVDVWEGTDRIVETLPVDRKYPFKSGINIMFGCNNFCSYCIVPYVRGRERSRKPEEILGEIKSLVAEGVIEIMLLGQNVNSYGKNLETPMSFAELLREVCKIEGLQRVRFMTSHPKDLSEELIQVMAEEPKICKHLHLPVQAGSDRVLREMNRCYDVQHYRELVSKLREKMPEISLTTDIIVGFPGETPEEALETAKLVREIGYDNAYTFIYSKRTGTKAASMEQPFSEEQIKENFNQVLNAVQETAHVRMARFTGLVKEVLVEEFNEQDSTLVTGKTEENITVHLKGDASMIGKILPVRLEEFKGFYFFGTKME